MKNNKGFGSIVILIIIVAVLAIGGSAYYFGKNSNSKIISKSLEESDPPREGKMVQSDCLLTSAPWIKVLSPNGGETYTAGQQITVNWKSCNGSDPQVMIILRSTQPVSGNEIATVPNTGTAVITLPITLPSGKFYKIITQLGGSAMGYIPPTDSSDNSFTINAKLTTQNENESTNEKNGKYIGYVKNVSSTNGNFSLKIDFIQMDGCTPSAPNYCMNGFIIANKNPLIRTFPISSNVIATVLTQPIGGLYNNGPQQISLSSFQALFQPNTFWTDSIPFWITLKSGGITEISEQYIP